MKVWKGTFIPNLSTVISKTRFFFRYQYGSRVNVCQCPLDYTGRKCEMKKTDYLSSGQFAALRLRLAFHWRGLGPHGRVKEWCAVSVYHSLTQPCGPKPRQWKAGLRVLFRLDASEAIWRRKTRRAGFETR